jgi:hydrogenase-1 operon protein HyaE
MLTANDQILARTITEKSAEFRALLDRLEQRNGIPRTTAAALGAGAEGDGTLAVLFTDEPHRCPEAWDAAVIFPELLKATPRAPRAAVLPPDESRTAARQFGVRKYPSILVLRDGASVGVLEGLRDWATFPAELSGLLAAPAGGAA